MFSSIISIRYNKSEEKKKTIKHRVKSYDQSQRFDFNAVKILDFEGNLFKRELSEMIHIYLNDSINFRTDTNNLSCILYIINS